MSLYRARCIDSFAGVEPVDDLQSKFNLTYLFLAHALSGAAHQ